MKKLQNLFIYFFVILSVQRKLQNFRQEAIWASSPQGSAPRTCCFSAAARKNPRLRTRFQSLGSRFKSSKVNKRVKRKHLKRQKQRKDSKRRGTTYEVTPQTTNKDRHDDIDDIFASIGFWCFGSIYSKKQITGCSLVYIQYDTSLCFEKHN